MEPEKVAVEQIDREAYLQWSALPPADTAAVMAGEWDQTTGMQILTRHRLSAEARSSGRGGVGEDALLKPVDVLIKDMDHTMLCKAVEGIADDWMSSKDHHPGYVLIPEAKFSELRVAARIMKMRASYESTALSQQPTATEETAP